MIDHVESFLQDLVDQKLLLRDFNEVNQLFKEAKKVGTNLNEELNILYGWLE